MKIEYKHLTADTWQALHDGEVIGVISALQSDLAKAAIEYHFRDLTTE